MEETMFIDPQRFKVTPRLRRRLPRMRAARRLSR